MSWSDEMADVVNECLTAFPGHILVNVGGLNPRTFPVCHDYRSPEAGLDALEAAMQPAGRMSFTMRRADFTATGIVQESIIARPSAPADRFHVTGIEDDEAKPFVRVTAAPMP